LHKRGCGNITIVDVEAERAKRHLVSLGLQHVEVAKRGGDALPAAQYIFSAVGRPLSIGAQALQSLEPGAVLFNCASRNEFDTDFLLSVIEGRIEGLSARALEGALLPEHQTLALTQERLPGRPTAFIRRRGQPAFDGREEKSVPVMDMAFAGVLAAAAEQTLRLDAQQTRQCEISFLSNGVQRKILKRAEDAYGYDLRSAIERLKP